MGIRPSRNRSSVQFVATVKDINMINGAKTAILPVKKTSNKYIIEISGKMWNSIQLLLLEGAVAKGIILEFDITKEGDEPEGEDNA